MKNPFVFRASVLLFSFMVFLSGCSRDDRAPISGKITMNGEPLAKASVTFIPEDQSSLNTRTGCITGQDGSFTIPKKRGLTAGTYVVSIYATVEYDGKTKELATVDTPPGRIAIIVLTPPEYNDRSTLRFSVTAKGPNFFECDVKSNISRKL